MASLFVLNAVIKDEFYIKLADLAERTGYSIENGLPDNDDISITQDYSVIIYPLSDVGESSLRDKIHKSTALGLRLIAIYMNDDLSSIPDEISVAAFASVTIGSNEIDEIVINGISVWEEPDGITRKYNDINRNRC